MEFFDVVDKNRKPMNKVLPRGCELKDDEFNTGVEVWILDKDNNLLITQRSKLKSHPLKWECPGGCCLAGETSIQTAIREMEEEIGITLLPSDLKLLDTHLYKYQFVDIYIARHDVDISNIELQKEEVCDVKKVSLNEFLQMANKGQIVKSVLDRFNLIKDYLINAR